MRDLAVVLSKEWLELRRSDSVLVAVATLLVFLSMIGIFLPWLIGPQWLHAPWVMLLWAWIPMFLVTTVTADAFAGERERRTLETLLATRLSDAAILWGKWLAGVAWVVVAMLLSFPLGIVSLNVMFAGTHLPSPGQVVTTVAVAFAAASFGGAIGIMVSLRATSVRHAQQVLAIIVFMLAFLPVGAVKLAPPEWTGGVLGALTTGTPESVGWVLVALLTVAAAPTLVMAQYRFRRGRMSLK